MFTKFKNNIPGLRKSNGLQFSLDKADSEGIAGWVVDPNNTDLAVAIEIRQGSSVLWSCLADNFRQDLFDAGISNGKNGFHCQFVNDVSHPIYGNVDVYVGEQKLNDSEIFINHQPAAMVQKSSPSLDKFRYHFDTITVKAIHGWARVLDNDLHKLTVECKVEDTTVGMVIANQHREDLKSAGIGDGNCSFSLKPDFSVLPEKETRFTLYLDGCLVPHDQFSMVLSLEDVKQAKLDAELEKFTSAVKEEIADIKSSVQKQNMNNGLPTDSIAGVCNVLIEKVAEINTRVAVIENAVLKHLK